MKRIIIFASGSGTNAENIIKYFQKRKNAVVTHVFSNNLRAKVLKRAHDLNVQALHFDKESFYDSNEVLNVLKDAEPDIIVLAGFLWIFPKKIIDVFPDKVINIHPALLPKYGGKGMYGNHVHEAVIRNKEKESGITIHFVNEHYDEGGIIFQTETTINENDSAEDLAKAIHTLEYKYFPVVIEKVLGLRDKI
ncbi:phosphoribosylglycinamide formyltransferase [Aquimarina litoralis]|uniref:phosphoribosylglycinamide formyltransferase n=1 Tax=Aquimarina litoralis TaxID=584605 RepID=UPI001C590CF8|nr:phosphoribosylglycinamide formyltransferase [Aquimarina litoralis]MBW1298892.1 phosphoribosylglycinamide formyltransferase [Aquimarina litoralis]